MSVRPAKLIEILRVGLVLRAKKGPITYLAPLFSDIVTIVVTLFNCIILKILVLLYSYLTFKRTSV